MSARTSAGLNSSGAPTSLASFFALPRLLPALLATIALTTYPDRLRDTAKADPRFPGPTIATLGLPFMSGSITESLIHPNRWK
jgi:hypothetical protein